MRLLPAKLSVSWITPTFDMKLLLRTTALTFATALGVALFLTPELAAARSGEESTPRDVAPNDELARPPRWGMGPFAKLPQPILSPTPQSTFHCPVRGRDVRWEEQNVYNPAAVVREGKVYLFYRADDHSPDLKWGRTCRIGMAWSEDGLHFTRHPTPVVYPDNDKWKPYEWEGGCEDLHIVEDEDGTYYMNYTTWNGHADTLSVASSRDLIHWTKHGPAFRKAGQVSGRSGVVVSRRLGDRLVAARIHGKYWMYYTHPCALAWSEDLINWTPTGQAVWPGGGREAGALALLRDDGILLMTQGGHHSLGAWTLRQALVSRDDLKTVLEEQTEPFLWPEYEWEKHGFTGNTTVANGLVPFNGQWLLYYGAADRVIGLAICTNHFNTSKTADSISYHDLLARLTDLPRLATPILPGEKTFASTSHDRGASYDAPTDTYRNWAANDDGNGCIRHEGDAQVMVDLKGPGVLWRIWSAMPQNGHIRIFLDGREAPAIDKPFRQFFDDYEKDYPGLAMTLSRGHNEFIPISFAKSCKVVMDKDWGRYFHCTHTLFPMDTRIEPFPGFTEAVVLGLRKASDAWLRRGENPYAPDDKATRESRTLTIKAGASQAVSLSGAAAIRVLKVTPLDLPKDQLAQENALRELTISILWDGESTPSVWSPLGDFFATSPGLNPFKTLPMGCVDGTFYSHWFMPFGDGARMIFANDGAALRRLKVELETVPIEKAEVSKLLRFCAAWHADDFTGLDTKRFRRAGGDRWPDWPLLVVEGQGRFVGMTEHIWKFGGWWGEGDEKFFIDGENHPSTIGTGSEDYIGYAWAAEPPFVTFDSALAACSRLKPDAQEDTSVCRFHLCDDLPFTQGFQSFIEVMPNGDCRPVLYDACVYWYRQKSARNPYPVVPLEHRRHRRPTRDLRHVVPSTLQVPPPKPGTVEGEALKVLRVGSGRHWIQDMSSYTGGSWSGNAQLIWTEGKQGDTIEIDFHVSKGGRQELVAVFTKAVDYGIFELAIDGKPLGRPLDLFDNHVTTTGEIPLGTLDLAPGHHVFTATAVGQNPKIKPGPTGGHLFGLDYLRAKERDLRLQKTNPLE